MSDNENTYDPLAPIGGVKATFKDDGNNEAAFEEALRNIPEPIVAQAAEPVGEPVEVRREKQKAKFTDTHTADNTTFRDAVDPKPSIIRELTTEEKESRGFLTVYLGNKKSDVLAAQQLISRWLQVEAVRKLYEDDRADETQLNVAESNWLEYCEANHPGVAPKDVAIKASDIYHFMSEIQDEVRVRSKVVVEEGLSNQSDRGGYITGDVTGQKPSRNNRNFKPSEMMRRTASKTADEALQFDVLLRDSFVKLNFMKPTRSEIGNLLNDIRRTVVGYVRTINNNNAVLARIAAQMEIWKFISKRITSCSISDISDFADLVNFITITDMDRLTTALIEAFNSKGVNMNLRCLSSKCNWETFALVDPSTLNQKRSNITAEEAAIFANLSNGRLKMTAEETHAMRRASVFGVEENRVYNDERSLYLEVAIPTLGEAWSTFEFYISKVNTELGELRSKITDPQEYDAQVGMVFANLGSTEYMHWVSGYVNLAAPDSGDDDIVFRRHDVDDPEFDMGIYDVIQDHDDLNRNLTKFILNKTPYMSRTFTGVANYVCPKCKARTEDHQDKDNYLQRLPGYTPICPVMSFFILTQLMMLSQVVSSRNVMKEVHSE